MLSLLDHLEHLPERKRAELSRAVKIVFEEFEQAQAGKQKPGRILKVILFGSYARGDWVEDRSSGYRSDYDLLVVVNIETWSEEHEVWHHVSEHFLREITITNRIKTPVNFIVHSLQDVNDKLSRGKPFFVDIARDGIVLYEESGHPLARPKALGAEEARAEAQGYYDQWYQLSVDALKVAEFSLTNGIWRHGAFMLHQATEEAYHCVLQVLTLYSPKSHRLKMLRSAAEGIDPRLISAWPRDTKFARRSFERLDRAYVDARYSPHYTITTEELGWIVERIKVLQELVEQICREKLALPA